MEGWVDLGGCLHTEMVYPLTDGQLLTDQDQLATTNPGHHRVCCHDDVTILQQQSLIDDAAAAAADDDDVDVCWCCRLKHGDCEVSDNDQTETAACFTLADAAESRDLTTFDPLAHRFRPYAPGGGYTCVTLLSPDRDDPEAMVASPGFVTDCERNRALEPLLRTGNRKPPATSTGHAQRCSVNTEAFCSTCIAKHRHLQSQHAQRQSNTTADVTKYHTWAARVVSFWISAGKNLILVKINLTVALPRVWWCKAYMRNCLYCVCGGGGKWT